MGKLKQFGIVFDGNVNVFSQGDVVRGQVVVVVDADKGRGLQKVKGIWVRFQGKAKTKWTTSDSNNKTTTHSLKESYFDVNCVIFGSGKYQRDIPGLNIDPGTSSFPFEFQLPAKPLPCPFEGAYGYVRYKAKVTLSLIKMISNKQYKSEKLFSVRGPTLDLNEIPETLTPVNINKELNNWCGCGCTVDRVISIGLPKRGYVPGESIYVTGHVDNRDGEEFGNFHASFVQTVVFRSRNHTKTKTYVLKTANSRVECPRGRVTNYSVGPLLIPPVPASGLLGCSIIDLRYHIKCKSPAGSKYFAVTIGTVPHRNVIRRDAVVATAPPIEFGGAFAGQAEASAPAFDYDAPPSYEEAVGAIDRLAEESNREEYFSQDRFVPRYPYFDITVDTPPSYKYCSV